MASTSCKQTVASDISCLNNLSEADILTLLEASLKFITQGLPKSVLKQHSQSLGLSPDDIENTITGVSYILLEFSRLKPSEEECEVMGKGFGLKETQRKVLCQFYRERERELEEILRDVKIDSSQFKDLQWRLETQIASRSLRNTVQPRVVLKLSLERNGETEIIPLISDIPNIVNWSRKMEEALLENSRKINF